MSVPPSNNPPPGGFPLPPQGGPPPGGYYYGQPPQRPVNNNAGCLKAFGITCGVLLLLGIIGMALLFKAGAPVFQQVMKLGQGVVQSQRDGRVIQQAVVAYHQKNGKYPASLMALVADGELTDAKVLHSSQDANPSPGHISWRYMRPDEGAPGDTPILDLPYQVTFAGQTQDSHVIVNLDGTTSSSHGTTAPPPAGNGP